MTSMVRYAGLLVFLSSTAAMFFAATASAADEYTGWTGRVWTGVVCRCVEDDNTTFTDATFGVSQLKVDGSSVGIGFDVERRFNRRWGLDVALGYTEADVQFTSAASTAVPKDTLPFMNLWLALNYHFITHEKFDAWVGPQIAYVIWLDNLSFNAPPAGTFNYKTDNEFPALGFEFGADWWVSNDWAVNFAFRFVDADADSDHNLPVDPTYITVGLARRF